MITPFTACQYLYPFQSYSQLKSKVVVNRTKFWTFLPSQILRGPQKLYTHYNPYLVTHHIATFHEAVPHGSNVMLNFKQIFDPHCKKTFASMTWLFYSTCKNSRVQHPLGARTWSSKKVDLGRYDLTLKSPKLLRQSSPDIFHPTWEESSSSSSSLRTD